MSDQIILGSGITFSPASALAQVITAVVDPVLQQIEDGQALSDALLASALDPLNYASTDGNITTVTAAYVLEGGAAVGTDTADAEDVYALTITVSDDAGTTPRVFNLGSRSASFATITPTGQSADGLSAAAIGDDQSDLEALLDYGTAPSSNGATTTVAVTFTNTGGIPLVENGTLTNVRMTFSADGATSVVVNLPVDITVVAAAPNLVILKGPDPAFTGPTASSDIDFYLAADGSDANDGLSEATPKATIQAVTDAAQAAGGFNTIAVRGGVYRQQSSFAGTTANFEFIRYGAELPRFTGMDLLTGWTQCTISDQPEIGDDYANMYWVDLPIAGLVQGKMELLNLHENGERRNVAMDRVVDETDTAYAWYDDRTFHLGSFNVDGNGDILSITDTAVLNKYSASQALDLVVVFYNGDNRSTRTTFSSFDAGTSTGTLTDQSKSEHGNGASTHIYGLINSTFGLKEGRWAARDQGNGNARVYFWPVDPANLTAGIEYSARDHVCDTADAQGDIIYRGIDGDGTTGDGIGGIGSVFGTYSGQLTAKAGRLTVEHANVGKTSGDNYGALYCATQAGGFRARHVKLYETNGIGAYTLDSPDAEFYMCLHQRHGKNAIRGFVGEDWRWLWSEVDGVARDTHANIASVYQYTNNSLIWGVKVRDGVGYITTSQASNFAMGFSDLQANVSDGDDRAFANQNRAPGSDLGGPDGSGAVEAGTRMIFLNTATRPDRSTDAPNSMSMGNLAEGTSGESWTHRNGLYHGLSDAPRAINDRASNYFSGLSSDQLAQLPLSDEGYVNALTLYRDPYNGDFDLEPDSPIHGRVGADITDLMAIIRARHPSFPATTYDIDGVVVNEAAPPIGPQVDPTTAAADPTVYPVAPVSLGAAGWFSLQQHQGWEVAENFFTAISFTLTNSGANTWLVTNGLNTTLAFLSNGDVRVRFRQEDGTELYFEVDVGPTVTFNVQHSAIICTTDTHCQVWLDGTLIVNEARPTVEPMRVPTLLNATAAGGDNTNDVDVHAVWSVLKPIDAATAAAVLFDPTTYVPTQAMIDGDTVAGVEPAFYEARGTAWPTLPGYLTPANAPPVVVPDVVTTPFETAVTYDVLANDTDADLDTLSVTAASVTSGGGSVVNNNDGTLTYTPATGYDGLAVVSYTISDGEDTDTGTLTVTVEAAASETDLMAGNAGDFGTSAGWTLDPDLSISGGQLSSAAAGNFSNASRSGNDRVPATPGQVISLELDVATRTNTNTVRVRLRAYDAADSDLELAVLVLNGTSNLVVGTNRYDDIYTVPANTVDLNVDIEYTIGPSDTVFDAIRLLV